jgi:hypothetical protein
MADPSNFILEKYTDHKRGYNAREQSDNWFRIREWLEEKKRYKLHEGFETEILSKFYLSKYLGVSEEIPFVDQTLSY